MNAVPHDFTKPARLTADWQQRLTGWFQLAFTLANKAWANQLPFPVDASLVELDVCYAQQALSTLSERAVAYRVLAADRRLATFLTLPRATLLKLIGAMLGDTDSTGTDRELTLIEENLADYFLVQYLLPYFRETWPADTLVSWELQPRESNPQSSRVYSAGDILIAMHWQLRGPWGESKGTWFVPKAGLLHELADHRAPPAETIPAAVMAARRDAIVGTIPVAIEIVVGTAEMKLSELSHLQIGDVVLLDQRPEDGLVARAGDQGLFRGKAGRLGSWKAFQIEAIDEN